MTDENVLPINPEDGSDPELAGRVARHYGATPGAPAGMAERCARYVIAHVTGTHAVPSAPARRTRVYVSGVAAIAAVALFAVVVRRGTSTPESAANAPTVASATTVDNGSAVQFELRLPKGAEKVTVVGDFNGWDTTATPMAHSKDREGWSAKVTLLPGRHIYAYVVDGKKWVIDPLAPQASDSDFGPANAVVVEGGTR